VNGPAKPALCVSQAIAAAMTGGLDRLDAQLLLLHALGKKTHERAWLHAHDTDMLAPTVQAAFDASVQRRTAGEPLAYITGHKEFFGLDLRVDARVLVPRPDTETLVEWALGVLPAVPNVCVLDLGTGSGAIALALKATRPELQLSAIDYSEEALAVARSNARRLQLDVQFQQGSWLDGVQARFQAIVSNPPYIAAQDQHLSALTHEPLQALASGPDGLDDIRRIIRQAPAHLHPGGWLLLEHGYDQAAAVRGLLTAAGFCDVQSRRDLSGIERCSGGRVPQA
jgi:release factor glutamine methyltransferase